jgi:hypothetical protein
VNFACGPFYNTLSLRKTTCSGLFPLALQTLFAASINVDNSAA